MVETKFDILNIEYLDVLTGEEVFDFPEQLYGISVDVPNDFKDKHFSFTEDLIRAEIESLFYRDGVDDLKVVDLTTFYAGTNDPLRGNYEDYEAETFEAESCVSCETPDWYWVGGLCSDSGELKCIGCCSCNDCHKRWSQLESGETDSNRQISSFSIDQKFHDAETYDVEFNEWADQEMMSHGKDISFKDWAEDEGMKHGNTEITDWAQHEDESHDARYGAENVRNFEVQMYNHSDGIWETIGTFQNYYDAEDLYFDVITDDEGMNTMRLVEIGVGENGEDKIIGEGFFAERVLEKAQMNAERKKRSDLLSEPFEGTSLDSGDWKGILTGFGIGLLGLFGYSKLRK